MAAILNSAILDSDTAILDSDTWLSSLGFTSKTFSLYSDSDWQLFQPDSNSFILTQLDDGSHLEFWHLDFYHFGLSHLSFFCQNSLILAKIGSNHSAQKIELHWNTSSLLHHLDTDSKLITHSFLLKLNDGGHLEQTILPSWTWWWWPSWIHLLHLWNSDILFSSLRITQKQLSLHSDSDSN